MIRSFFSRCALVALLGVAGSSGGLAQSGRPPANGPVKPQITFLLVAGAKPAADAFVPGPKGSTVPVRLSVGAKSAPVTYEGPSPLVLYVPKGKTPAERVALASVPLPPGSARVLVLLAPGGNSAGVEVYRGVAVDDDPALLPPGSLRFLNYAGKGVAVQVGKEMVTLALGPSQVFPVARGASAPVEVAVQIASQETSGMERAYATTMKVQPNERHTLIILPSTKPNGRGVTVLPSRDVGPPAAPAPGVRSLPPRS